MAMVNGLVLGLLLATVATSTDASPRPQCRRVCADAVVSCAAQGARQRDCRRQIIDTCVREGLRACRSTTVRVRQARELHTHAFEMPRPAGLTFSPGAGLFFVRAAGDGRIAMMTPFAEPVGAVSLPIAGIDPINIAFDAREDRILLLDTAARQLVGVRAGPDGRPDSAEITRTEIDALGSLSALGMTVDPGSGAVLILDGRTRRVARIRRGRLSWTPLRGLGQADLRGIAVNPANHRLFVLGPVDRVLYELTPKGRALAAYDLSRLDLDDPQAIVFAPSGDLTDDDATLSLYVADTGNATRTHGHVFELALGAAVPVPLATISSSLVHTIDTSRFSPPSPDPSGLAYNTATGRLVMVDGEVDEVSIWAGVNYWELSLGGSVLATGNARTFTREPVGAAFNALNGHLYISDDDALKVYDVNLGADGRFGTSDDSVRSFSTSGFGSHDPEGITFDRVNNRLFIADGVNAEIYEIRPGSNGVFDGGGDDVIRHFDTAALGASDPESVEFNPDTGTLYTMGSGADNVVEVTTTGTLVNRIGVAFLPLQHAAGIAYAPGSNDPGAKHLYIADRAVDNCQNPKENDGKIYEVTLGPGGGGGGGTGPGEVRVAASSDDAEEAASGTVSLSSGDLELVFDGSNQTVGLRFTGVAIPRAATITNAWVQFKVDETQSEATSLTIRSQAADNPPTFAATAGNVSSRPRTTAAVSWSPVPWTTIGEVGPNERTPNLAPIVQEIVNRSGWASGNAIALIITGTGHRTAKAYDGDQAGAPLLHVEFGTNQAPSVDAGPNRTIILPATATLDGTVTDDGHPSPPSLTTTWTRDSGPGTVTFANASAVDTTASFSAAGTYVLRLTANDGALTASDTMTVVVNPASSGATTIERRVAAGTDDAEEDPTGSMYVTSSDLELVFDTSNQTVGVRFATVTVPRGATIVNAWVQFKVDETQSEATSLTIQGQAADNAAGFSSAANISSRSRTTAVVGWAPPPWTTVGQVGPDQRTPGLVPIIQAIVNRPGWVSGNALVLIFTGTGHRTAESFEGDAAGAPLLHVEYQ